jgi:hypothetical protein
MREFEKETETRSRGTAKCETTDSSRGVNRESGLTTESEKLQVIGFGLSLLCKDAEERKVPRLQTRIDSA